VRIDTMSLPAAAATTTEKKKKGSAEYEVAAYHPDGRTVVTRGPRKKFTVDWYQNAVGGRAIQSVPCDEDVAYVLVCADDGDGLERNRHAEATFPVSAQSYAWGPNGFQGAILRVPAKLWFH